MHQYCPMLENILSGIQIVSEFYTKMLLWLFSHQQKDCLISFFLFFSPCYLKTQHWNWDMANILKSEPFPCQPSNWTIHYKTSFKFSHEIKLKGSQLQKGWDVPSVSFDRSEHARTVSKFNWLILTRSGLRVALCNSINRECQAEQL